MSEMQPFKEDYEALRTEGMQWDKWLDAWFKVVPDDVYEPCPCGCGKKLRFAMKEGLDKHVEAYGKKVCNG